MATILSLAAREVLGPDQRANGELALWMLKWTPIHFEVLQQQWSLLQRAGSHCNSLIQDCMRCQLNLCDNPEYSFLWVSNLFRRSLNLFSTVPAGVGNAVEASTLYRELFGCDRVCDHFRLPPQVDLLPLMTSLINSTKDRVAPGRKDILMFDRISRQAVHKQVNQILYSNKILAIFPCLDIVAARDTQNWLFQVAYSSSGLLKGFNLRNLLLFRTASLGIHTGRFEGLDGPSIPKEERICRACEASGLADPPVDDVVLFSLDCSEAKG